MRFAKELLQLAKVYANYANGKDPLGAPGAYLGNISRFSGAARQHFILLLAGNHLPSELFNELCKHLERLLFCYFITREQSKALERNFATWSPKLKTVKTRPDLHAFLKEFIVPEIVSHSNQFLATFGQLSQKVVRQQYRQRYILAKLSQYVQRVAYNHPDDISLDQYWSYHIEHILPQGPTKEVLAGFDKPDEYAEYVQRFGNLTLLEQPINCSVSNDPFADKKDGYLASKLLLTKSMVTNVKVGTNTTINQMGKHLKQFDKWNSVAITDRQMMLAELARKVWLVTDVDQQ